MNKKAPVWKGNDNRDVTCFSCQMYSKHEFGSFVKENVKGSILFYYEEKQSVSGNYITRGASLSWSRLAFRQVHLKKYF
jgi:hypothetical protein